VAVSVAAGWTLVSLADGCSTTKNGVLSDPFELGFELSIDYLEMILPLLNDYSNIDFEGPGLF
jgi:hypothetical protein